MWQSLSGVFVAQLHLYKRLRIVPYSENVPLYTSVGCQLLYHCQKLQQHEQPHSSFCVTLQVAVAIVTNKILYELS